MTDRINPAEHLILSDCSNSIRNVMRAAHERAKRRQADHNAWRAEKTYPAGHPLERIAVPYSQFFQETLQWAWDRARTTRRLINERGWNWYQPNVRVELSQAA
jgi:hypothetical protein